MIPGKQYKPEDFIGAAWRRRWLIAIPFVVVSAVTVVISQVLPDQYRSEALLQIVPQQVPENYVRSAVTADLTTRLQAIQQQILSRTQLERIIQEFDLYPDQRRRMIMEDVVDEMRTKHVILGGPAGRIDTAAFKVGFEYGDPKTAQHVAERLASLFIKANIQDRSVNAEQTDQFLQTQLDDTRRQLKEYEAKLEEFRRANPGRMPGEVQANQQALGSAQAQLQALQESINRDRDRQLMLQRMIADASNVQSTAPPVVGPTGAPSAARVLEQERARLRDMQTRLKPTHPDIGIQQRRIRDLEQKAAAEALEQPVSPGISAATPADAVRISRAAELQAEADVLERRIASKQEDERRLLATMNSYRQRIESAPAMESRMSELMRDYTTMQTTYQNLLAKSQEAKAAANIERRGSGEQFRIIDPARLPKRPSSPNRPRIILLGSFVALALGFGLAGLLEYRDTSLRTEDDVIVALALPVLALVPTMTTAAERRRQRRAKVLFASSGALAVVLGGAVLAWKFRAIADWIR